MKMKKNNLVRVKGIGPARLRQLKNHGIATFSQLHQIPVEKLAGIKTFGKHNAARIKKEVASHATNPQPSPKTNKSIKPDTRSDDEKLRKTLKKLTKQLIRADESLKPLWKKKYLAPYIDFKKSTRKLTRRIKTIAKQIGSFSSEETDVIIQKANALSRILIKDAKKPKKKGFKKITAKIKTLSKTLKAYKL